MFSKLGALRLPDTDECRPPSQLKPGCGLLVLASGNQHVKEGVTNWVKALVTQDPVPRCTSLEAHVYTDQPDDFTKKLAEFPQSRAKLAQRRWSLHLHDVQELLKCAEYGLKGHDLFKYYLKILLMKQAGTFEISILADTDIQLKRNDALAQYIGLLDGHDLVLSLERNPFGGSSNNRTFPGPRGLDMSVLKEYSEFQERNTGFVVFNMRNPAVRQLTPLWGQHLAACMKDSRCKAEVIHDQPAFREALFELRSQIRERQCTPDTCCREAGMYVCPKGICTPKSCWFWHAHSWDLLYPSPVEASRTLQCECA